MGVGNADAIIVHLQKAKKELIILIDGGKAGNAKPVQRELDLALEATGKKGPDLVICTHYDSDHIGGLIKLVQHYGNAIGELWMHPTLKTPKVSVKKSDLAGRGSILSNFGGTSLASAELLITSIKEQQRLSALVKSFKSVKVKSLFAGECSLAGWQEIKLLGPVKAYYNKLFPKNIPTVSIREEGPLITSLLVTDGTVQFKRTMKELDNVSKTITPVNLASAILLIIVKKKKFLFTGDAGLDSFTNIPNYKKLLKSIYWLKVPHHGSPKNFNGEMIRLMSPVISCISGEIRKNALVPFCLARSGSQVHITGRKKVCMFSF